MIMKEHKHVEIMFKDRCVELTVDESVFKLALDDRGLPLFPESVKQQLPPWMPKEVEETISRMRNVRQNETHNLDVVHQYWCDELAGIGMCDCDPVLCHYDIRGLTEWYEGSWGTLTCVVCHESSNGRTGLDRVWYNGDRLFEKHWVYKDNEQDNDPRVYWAFSSETLICEDCLRNIMSETRIRFPHVIDDVERSPSVRRRRPVSDRGRLRLVK